MQEFMETYNENYTEIESFIHETVANLGDIRFLVVGNFQALYKAFNALELVYVCDSDNFDQISANIYRNRIDPESKGVNRAHIFGKLEFDKESIAISKPYVSSSTGKICITLAKKEDNRTFLLDFTLVDLLQKLGLIELHKEFNFINKSFYLASATIMMILAVFTLGYAVFSFINSILINETLSIESIFKPIIALTLGIAIFDLSKTVLEQEVLFKSYSKNNQAEYKVLTKFSVTIMIALLIESLMVVFKIAMNDYSQMIHATYLIGAISVLLVSLGLFIYLSKKS